ncbi:DNA replication endonuclease-helicase Dna2 [Emydomyces testavorans]|uniref:DNA replication ATP-dependent helicase/nuclease n=1 Tax=Emydomyces testavorans TaxID=2070801 RepID=A0AAF0DMK4_9EURO|nr:DNA replication endonuclease-helicase Dna2 [Emydomyces testavorans]
MSASDGNCGSKTSAQPEQQESCLPPIVKQVKEASADQDRENSPPECSEAKLESNCPQTPAHRIPLADLISNTEDAFNKAPGKVPTPDDHVYWDHRSSSSNNKPRSAIRRGKKRARSSSPTSSPLNKDVLVELQPVQPVMKTPQHDVAADLWNRYVGKNSGIIGGDLPKFHISQLASSPQTPAPQLRVSRDGSGLRRANSCNIDWPTSTNKRRKLDSDQQRTNKIRDGFTRSRTSLLAPDRPKSSRIGLLVEKIQETLLNCPRDDPNAPSSSSPLPDRSEIMESGLLASPPKQTIQNQPIDTPSKCAPGLRHNNQPVRDAMGADSQAKLEVNGTSSEFGDDDLDHDFLELAVGSPKNLFSPRAGSPKLNEPARQIDKIPTLRPTDSEHYPFEEDKYHNSDEFNDVYDEFDDGLEELMAQYDTKALSASQTISGEKTMQAPVQQKAMNDKIDRKVEMKGEQSINKGAAVDLTFDDEFDDDIDLQAIEDAMRKDTGITTSSTQVLRVQEERTKKNRAIALRESWFDTPCKKGFYIHLVGDFDAAGQCIVDDANNMIILHPDHLISATVVADSFSCQRRAVLQDRIKATSDASKPQVYGHILHEVFQEAMKANRWELDWLKSLIETTLPKYLEQLYQIHMEPSEAAEYLQTKMPALRAWAEVFIHNQPTPESTVEDRNGTKARLCINKLLEVEEHVWSPTYGLKGNVDATVQVVLQGKAELKTLTVPLELKTGRNSTNETHRAQTALYSLLLSDRYDIDVTFGLLYYLEVSKTQRVRAIPAEIRQMIQQRNRLAGYVRERLDLPPMLKNPRLCNQCYAKSSCFVYHKLMDEGDGESSGMGKNFTELVGHLMPSHQAFFKKWDLLLTQEEKEMMKFRRELWTMLSNEREAVGRCFSNVVIEPESGLEDSEGSKINRFRYTFVKHKASLGFSFADSQITVGEPIVVSDEKGHFALANGYVVQISSRRLTVAVDRRLHNARRKMAGFHPSRNQTFVGIMEVSDGTSKASSKMAEEEEVAVYRIDKDEFSNGMATVRNNLVCMMDKTLFRSRPLRDLIIDGVPPSFKPSSSVPAICASAQSTLNVDQKQAIEKVMSANDYALVLGMPGTGKTTTIAQIIRALVSQGKSVLLASYTHTAVDNILLKIRNDKIKILRLGAPAKIHSEVQQFADLAGLPKDSIEELKDSYENSQVVATTCLGINHCIFNSRTFDYCIVDEASQITLPVCLGPIRMAKTFILVGDHYQLPPLVQSKDAQDGGLDVSLFKLLCDMHPGSVVNLEHQYRMCEEIMLLSNTLIYSGHLKCGTPAVASRSLKIPDMNGLKQHHINPLNMSSPQLPCLGPSHGRCWLHDLLDPRAKARLVNTDLLNPEAVESAKGSRIVNPVEAVLCMQLVEALLSVGISAQDIGVVTLYRSQLALLKQHLRHRLPDLEMHTADRFQGRDKEVIIMSCVRSNAAHNVGDLLRDWRRVNVAFTRARTKLLIVGSKTTLREGNELLGRFVRLMDGKGWCYNLPPMAVAGHVFDEGQGFTQVSPKKKSPVKKKKKEEESSPAKTRPRKVLSPVKNRGNLFGVVGGKKAEKVGGNKAVHVAKMVGQRPVLRDVYNEMLG